MNRLQAILFTFALCTVTGSVAKAQALQRITVYVQNPTSVPVNFSYRIGEDDWKKCQIQSGYTQTMTGIANHMVAYNDNQGHIRQFTLSVGCTVYFRWSEGTLSLLTRTKQ